MTLPDAGYRGPAWDNPFAGTPAGADGYPRRRRGLRTAGRIAGRILSWSAVILLIMFLWHAAEWTVTIVP